LRVERWKSNAVPQPRQHDSGDLAAAGGDVNEFRFTCRAVLVASQPRLIVEWRHVQPEGSAEELTDVPGGHCTRMVLNGFLFSGNVILGAFSDWSDTLYLGRVRTLRATKFHVVLPCKKATNSKSPAGELIFARSIPVEKARVTTCRLLTK